MTILRAIGALLGKTFVADLWLTLAALASVALCWIGLRADVLTPTAAPFVLAAGVLGALAIGVVRGTKR